VTGDLLSADLQRVSNNFTAALRAGYFSRSFTRGALAEQPSYGFGAFTGHRFHFIGEDLVRSQDTAGARAPIAGLTAPDGRSSAGSACVFPAAAFGDIAECFREPR
jgi:hypothetical protein